MFMLVIICGLPGTGKSFVAEIAAKKLDAALLRTDAIRKTLFPRPAYTEEEKMKVYQEMFRMATEKLAEGNVVLDAVFPRESLRKRALSLTKDSIIIQTVCSEDIAKKRLSEKRLLSDADYDVYLKIKNEFEPLQEKHCVINTEAGKDKIEKEIQRLLA
ncbi:MAG: AAA family ATPase [Candidatus Aenigmarchaeota archaeon]|nr:AAA family ATPase [Candidatus Aenigmarchaeota archaeon]